MKKLKHLEKLLFTTLETAIEAMEKKHWSAFINNGFATIGILANLPELAAEVQEVRNNLALLEELESRAKAKFKDHSDQIIINTFRKVYSAIIFNIATGIEIAEDWKKEKTKT